MLTTLQIQSLDILRQHEWLGLGGIMTVEDRIYPHRLFPPSLYLTKRN